MDDVLKICSKCRTPLPLHLFAKDKTKASGLRPNCKQCDKEYRLGKKLYEQGKSVWKNDLGILHDVMYVSHRKSTLWQRIKGWFKTPIVFKIHWSW